MKHNVVVALLAVCLSATGLAKSVSEATTTPREFDKRLVGYWECDDSGSSLVGDNLLLTVSHQWIQTLSNTGRMTHTGSVAVTVGDAKALFRIEASGTWYTSNNEYTSDFEEAQLVALTTGPLSDNFDTETFVESIKTSGTASYSVVNGVFSRVLDGGKPAVCVR